MFIELAVLSYFVHEIASLKQQGSVQTSGVADDILCAIVSQLAEGGLHLVKVAVSSCSDTSHFSGTSSNKNQWVGLFHSKDRDSLDKCFREKYLVPLKRLAIVRYDATAKLRTF